MSRYCLDTSAYSQFQRGEERVVSLLDQADWIAATAARVGALVVTFDRHFEKIGRVGSVIFERMP